MGHRIETGAFGLGQLYFILDHPQVWLLSYILTNLPGNLVCADLQQLGREFWAAAGRLLSKPEVLRSCIKQVGYVY